MTYELGNAEVHRLDPGRYQLAISRFGTMFFADPLAAFANIASALRPQGRLALLVWRRRERNEWALTIDAAVGEAAQLAPPPGADPFSLGDAEATTAILERAGFAELRFEDVHEPVHYGHDVAAALEVVRGFQNVRAALARMSSGDAASAVDRLRKALAARWSEDQAWPSVRAPG